MRETDNVTSLTRTLKRRPGQRLTAQERKDTQEKFLKSFANTANVRASCMASNISRNTIYEWLEKDEQFSLRYHQAEKDATDLLLAAAWERAVKGYRKPVVSMGKQVFINGEPLTET